ncbi:MAG: hypothetical protein WCA04_14970 [Geobacteraceae bacterium]
MVFFAANATEPVVESATERHIKQIKRFIAIVDYLPFFSEIAI